MRSSVKIMFVASAILGCAVSGPALAGPPTEDVAYSRSELASPEGAEAVYDRIAAAAHRVCRLANMGVDNPDAAAARCETRALETAVRESGLDALSAVHEARNAHGTVTLAESRH